MHRRNLLKVPVIGAFTLDGQRYPNGTGYQLRCKEPPIGLKGHNMQHSGHMGQNLSS